MERGEENKVRLSCDSASAALYVTFCAKRDYMSYFVKNELYTIPDSPVNADFNVTFCTGVKCVVAKL